LAAQPSLYEELGDRRGVAESLLGLGNLATVQRRYREGRALLEQAVQEARAVGDSWLAALALSFIANGIPLQGDPAAARPVYEQARDAWLSPGARRPAAATAIVQIGSARSIAATTNRAAPWCGRGCRWPTSWTSRGGSC
jgi:hypothetical protein